MKWMVILLVPLLLTGCGLFNGSHSPDLEDMLNDHGKLEGCSWYCGSPPISVEASSTFHDGYLSYDPCNLHDAKKDTVWAHGAYGNGIGEKISFLFDERDNDNEARIGVSYVSIINGYARSRKLWKANSRVKSFKVSFNGKEIMRLELADTMQPQQYDLPELLFRGRKLNELTFEILEIYPGKETDRVAMADFYFQGFGQMH